MESITEIHAKLSKTIIKYRVWDILSKKMKYWGDIMNLPAWEIFPGTPEQRAFNVMAYLQLRDKLGKELYAGDVVKTSGRKGFSVLVQDFYLGVCNAVYTPKGWRYYPMVKNQYTINGNHVQEFTKVGDIYTSPELLEIMKTFKWKRRDNDGQQN